jgi:hemolysin D
MSHASSGAVIPVPRRSGSKDAALPAILEFQWPSTAIINAPIPRLARGMIWIITSMVVVFIAAAGVIPVDQVVTVRGIVVSQSRTILVQPLDTAIVRTIEVREGDRVKAGDVLARLDPTFAAADLATLTAQVSGLEAEVSRLKAEADGQPFTYAGLDPAWQLQLAIHKHRLAEFESKLDNFRHRADELSTVIARAQSDAVGYRERLGVAQTVEQMWTHLEAVQSGSKLNQLMAKDSRAEMARALANAEQTGEGAKRDKSALEADRNGYIQGWRAEVSQRLAEANGKMSDAREQLNKAKLRRQLVELRSELDAIVQSVAKVSVGSVLQSGQQFITLVPADAPLEIESNIFGRDNGFVHVGDPVVIKFDTFPYAQYGAAEGTVRTISPNSFTAEDEARLPTGALPAPQTASEPFYRTRIAIDRVALHDVPMGFQLIPGMPVTADIKVGKRTVLKYLLGMVVPIGREAMREP